jgi:hypothetical protein
MAAAALCRADMAILAHGKGGDEMSASFPHHSPFPIQRAFVVQFAVDTALGEATMAGRVEPIVSGQAMQFQSLDELLAFVTRILQTLTAAEDLCVAWYIEMGETNLYEM